MFKCSKCGSTKFIVLFTGTIKLHFDTKRTTWKEETEYDVGNPEVMMCESCGEYISFEEFDMISEECDTKEQAKW